MGLSCCTVVMPVYNQWRFTAQCLESLKVFTDVSFDLVVVDNGSTDETPDELRRWERGGKLRRFEIVRNAGNLGVAKAWNQGMALATSGPVCFINNDVVVSLGWLGFVLGFLTEQPQRGICSPHVIDGEPPKDFVELASRHALSFWDQIDDGFHGCCFVVSREVIERVGLFDEGFQIAQWEDVDYWFRARKAGFSPAVTHRAVVYHSGSRTIAEVARSLGGRNLYAENMQRFMKKWGISLGNFTVSRSMLITQ